MADTQKRTPYAAYFVRAFQKVERYVWLISAGGFILLLFIGYRYILQPQYQQLLAAREDERVMLLNEQKERMEQYLDDVQRFIELSDMIRKEDRERLSSLFTVLPEHIIFEQQLKKFFSMDGIELTNVTLGVSVPSREVTAEGADEDAEGIIDGEAGFSLRRLLEQSTGETDDTISPDEESGEIFSLESISPERKLYVLPVKVEYIADSYFQAKSVLEAIEGSLPLMDVDSFSISVGIDGIAAVSLSINISHVL